MHYICSRIRSYKSINIVSVPDVHIECVVRSTSTCGCGCVKLNKEQMLSSAGRDKPKQYLARECEQNKRIELLNFA